MNVVASKDQLRMSFLRWALVAVPAIVLLGFLSGSSVAGGNDSQWYQMLRKPDLTPPSWVFPVAWSTLYVLMGLALANVLNARGAAQRTAALLLFAGQFLLNLVWTPVFFGQHRLDHALFIIVAMIVVAIATTIVFARVRRIAAWLMLPYLVWISFAGVLNWRIMEMNPNAQALVPAPAKLQISL